MSRDGEHDQALRRAGYRFVRLWESESKDDRRTATGSVEQEMRREPSLGSPPIRAHTLGRALSMNLKMRDHGSHKR